MFGPNTIGEAPLHGIMGTASVTNTPGGRAECKSGWVDAANNLWLFGGQDGATANTLPLNVRNDLWKYDIVSNMWTWMKGPTIINNTGVFGTMGVETSTNNPPSRISYTKWKGKDGNFYVFAGGNNTIARNDLWRYNPVTNNWTWISGSNAISDTGVYNTTCNPQSGEYPSARIENQTTATRPNYCTETFWSFGGLKTVINSESFYDLWLYNATNNKWTWVSGAQNTNYVGNYGTLNLPAPGNMIGSRGGVFMWADTANNLWVFGGITYDSSISGLGLKNDLWKFVPDTSCFHANLNSDLTLVAPMDTIIISGDTTGMVVPPFSILIIQPSVGFNYNSDSSRLIFSPVSTTTYTIIASEKGLCSGKDTIIFTIVVEPYPEDIKNILGGMNFNWTLSPNPTDGVLTITFEKEFTGSLKISDAEGKTIENRSLKNILTKKLNLQYYSNGIYFIEISNKTGRESRQFVIKH